MGFFSFECPGCDQSIRHPGACAKQSKWMSNGVFVDNGGNRVRGSYDGYGRLGTLDVGELMYAFEKPPKFAVYHEACWNVLGKPEFSTPSKHARDQGHFVGEYDPAEPTTVADLADMRERAAREVERGRRAYEGHKKRDEVLVGQNCPNCDRDHRGFIVALPAGKLGLRCAKRECNTLQEIPEDKQATLWALFKEYEQTPEVDDEVNADLTNLRHAQKELAEEEKWLADYKARGEEPDHYLTDNIILLRATVATELKRLGRSE